MSQDTSLVFALYLLESRVATTKKNFDIQKNLFKKFLLGCALSHTVKEREVLERNCLNMGIWILGQ